ncbi:MAG: 4-hydroxy-tetrahydrodipicolinate reductase [Thermotogae bacterium]|nr:4-hydroxy-tetrahydrodipicolinate reductase [Thermotogota bacterium]
MKYGIIGRSGRMGSEVDKLFKEKAHELVFSYDETGEFYEEVPEVLIDFSSPAVFDKVVEYTKRFMTPLIIGTTGLTEGNFETLRELSKELPVVQSYNFSMGIQILLKLVEFTNEHLPDADVEIIEIHHRFKKDKPSGTAKMIKEVLNKDVNISSLRLGNVSGDHAVLFGNLGEVITISHRALSRRTFAEGVLRSAEFVLNAKPKLYTFSEVFQR